MAKEKVCFQKAKPGWLFFDGYCYKRGCELLINLKSLWSKINPLNLKKCCYYKAMQWWSWSPGVIGATPHTHKHTEEPLVNQTAYISCTLSWGFSLWGVDLTLKQRTIHTHIVGTEVWSTLSSFLTLMGTIIHQVNNMFHQIKRATESIKSSGECLMRS